MTIRPVRDDDFAALAVITNHYVATTAVHFAYDPVPAETMRASWRAHPHHPFLVLEDGGVVQSYAKAVVWRDRAAYAWTCEVGVYVAHHVRGRGLGTAVYAQLLATCAGAGFRSAVAGITLPNDASVALHAHLGFVSTGIVRDAGYKLGRWYDVHFFQKTLSTGDAPPVPF
jgi:L-amino acid N-acyltransferase YncA